MPYDYVYIDGNLVRVENGVPETKTTAEPVGISGIDYTPNAPLPSGTTFTPNPTTPKPNRPPKPHVQTTVRTPQQWAALYPASGGNANNAYYNTIPDPNYGNPLTQADDYLDNGGGGGTAEDADKYKDNVDAYRRAYQNSLSKYEVQVRAAENEAVGNTQSAYVQMMQQRRTLGTRMAQGGFAQSTGYVNRQATGIGNDYQLNRRSALSKYQQSVFDINQDLKDLAFETNEDLTKLYNSNKDAGVVKQRVSTKQYGYKYTR